MNRLNFGNSIFGGFFQNRRANREFQDSKTLARFDFAITFGKRYQREFSDNYDEKLDDVINDLQEILTVDFTEFVQDLLGDDVSVRIDKLEKGSIVGTITLVLVSAMSVYTYISQFKDFVESLELIRDQLYSKITRVLGKGNNLWDTNITIVITRLPIVMHKGQYRFDEPSPIYSKAFFWYLLIANIVLSALLVLLLYKAAILVYFTP